MNWIKHGIIFSNNPSNSWSRSHCMVPTPIRICDNELRIFFTSIDDFGIGRIGFFDVVESDPSIVIRQSVNPVLEPGPHGCFDENGVICCSVVRNTDGSLNMYYAGFELGTKIRYRLLTGLAISTDNGLTFKRFSNTPVLERSESELYFRGGPFCLKGSNSYRLWYCAGSTWKKINNKLHPVYNINYIESCDGINWPKSGKPQIVVESEDEFGFGRPSVFEMDGLFHMIYSIRDVNTTEYRIGYAISMDSGLSWIRKDNELNLGTSSLFFESKAIMYGCPIQTRGGLYLFYNGDSFGKDGVALAQLNML